MDIARTASDCVSKLFRDSDQVNTVHWYRAPVGAKFFPHAHKVNHLSWYTEPWKANGVGEVYGGESTYNNGFTPPNVTGQDFYGPLEYFQRGAPFDPTHHTARDFWGLAIACTHGINSGVGGEAFGEEAVVSGCRCVLQAGVLFARFTFVTFPPCPQLDGLLVPMLVPGFVTSYSPGPAWRQMACSGIQNTGGVPWRLALYCLVNSNASPGMFLVTADGSAFIAATGPNIPHTYTCSPFQMLSWNFSALHSVSPCLFGHCDIDVTQ